MLGRVVLRHLQGAVGSPAAVSALVLVLGVVVAVGVVVGRLGVGKVDPAPRTPEHFFALAVAVAAVTLDPAVQFSHQHL